MNKILVLAITAIAAFTVVISSDIASAQQVTTLAGVPGTAGSTDGTGPVSRFNEPVSVATDKLGNVYVADKFNNKIRKITTNGTTSTLAGTGVAGSTDGQGSVATFHEPWGIACDTLGNVYVADTRNYKIRRIDMNGTVTTIAGVGVFGTTNGPVTTARFGFPVSLAVSPDGSVIYVSEYQTHVIRKIQGGQVFTIAGAVYMPGANDGSMFAASFYNPHGLALAPNGDVFIADEGNSKIRRMTSAGTVTTLSGTGLPGSTDGSVGTAQFNFPTDVTVDALGNVFVADAGNQTVRKIDATTGVVSTYAGTTGLPGHQDGIGNAAFFQAPSGIAFNRAERALVVGERLNHTLRKITPLSTLLVNLAVNGNSIVCSGQNINLQVTAPGLNQFSVSVNGTSQAGSVGTAFTMSSLPSGTHVLQVTAMDPNGATAASNTVLVTVLPAFVPQITSPTGQVFCPGDTLVLNATAGTSYLWSDGSTASQVRVTQAGNYLVTVTNADGCSGTSTPFAVSIHSVPNVQIAAPADSVCPGQAIALTSTMASSWAWSEGSTTQTIQVSAGTYQVTVTTSDGCSAASSPFTVHEYEIPDPVIQLTGPVYFFQGDSVSLSASGLSIYLWSTGGSGSSVWISNPGTITVTGWTSAGCPAGTDTVQVAAIGPSDLIQAQGSLYFCQGDSVTLSTLFSNNIQWYYEGQALPGATGSSLIVDHSGWYYVSVNHQGNWYSSDSLQVTVHPKPDIPDGIDTSFCEGSTFSLTLPSIAGVNYHWYETGSGGSPVQSGLLFSGYAQSGATTYFLEAENAWGCISDGRSTVDIRFEAIPTASFTHVVNENGTGHTVTLTAGGNANDTFYWLIVDPQGQIQTETGSQVLFNANSTGIYDIVLTTTSSAGCTDSIHRSIVVGTVPAPYIPTTFTPNGDGKNDVFRVRGEQLLVEEMRIYDQWGTLIFVNNGPNTVWDGMSGGRPAPNATYLYQIRITDPLNTSRQLTGPVTLIR